MSEGGIYRYYIQGTILFSLMSNFPLNSTRSQGVLRTILVLILKQ